MTTRTKSVLPLFTIIGALVIVSAESAMAAGINLGPGLLDEQCRHQYGRGARAILFNGRDAKSWKCTNFGAQPQPINVSEACRRAYGNNYFANTYRVSQIDPRTETGWRCVRKGI